VLTWEGAVTVAAIVAVVAFMAWLIWLQRRRDLVVVKKVQQFMDANYDASFMFDSEAMNGSNAFWYCSGPGARWFLAIPAVSTCRSGVDVRWVLRPLTEQRVRAVLRFDRVAYQRAFGETPD